MSELGLTAKEWTDVVVMTLIGGSVMTVILLGATSNLRDQSLRVWSVAFGVSLWFLCVLICTYENKKRSSAVAAFEYICSAHDRRIIAVDGLKLCVDNEKFKTAILTSMYTR